MNHGRQSNFRGTAPHRYKTAEAIILWCKMPRSTGDLRKKFGGSPEIIRSMVRDFIDRGWMVSLGVVRKNGRGRPAEMFKSVELPSYEEFAIDHARRRKVDTAPIHTPSVASPEVLDAFDRPRSIAEAAKRLGRSELAFRGEVRRCEERGELYRAGKRRGAHGPPIQLFCSDRSRVGQSILQWVFSEELRRRALEKPTAPHRIVRLDELVLAVIAQPKTISEVTFELRQPNQSVRNVISRLVLQGRIFKVGERKKQGLSAVVYCSDASRAYVEPPRPELSVFSKPRSIAGAAAELGRTKAAVIPLVRRLVDQGELFLVGERREASNGPVARLYCTNPEPVVEVVSERSRLLAGMKQRALTKMYAVK